MKHINYHYLTLEDRVMCVLIIYSLTCNQFGAGVTVIQKAVPPG